MKQVLHIFKKDARHCWPQIGLLVIIMVAYTWSEVRSWRPAANYIDAWYGQFLAPATVLLVIAGWWSLLGRSIQDEKLVGDTQFWVTRPYRWRTLLAAKGLFALIFINVPLLIVQLILLAAAGFNPWHSIPGLLWMQVILWISLLLPVAALATVTSTLGQILIMLLAGGVYLIGVAVLGSQMPTGFSTSESVFNLLSSVVVIGGGLTIILWQYSRRRTAHSRGLLAGCAALIPAMMVAIPYGSLIDRDFPMLASGQPSPVQLSFDASRGTPKGGPEAGKEVNIFLPMLAAGVADDSVVAITGEKAVVEGPDGFHWSSGWIGTYRAAYPWSSRADTGFQMKRAVFDQIKEKEVKLRMVYALTVYRSVGWHQVTVEGQQFNLPGVGICELSSGYRNGAQCRAPIKQPALLITADTGSSPCPPLSGQRAENGYSWNIGGDTRGGISPVRSFVVGLENVQTPRDEEANPAICPGMTLVVRTMEPVQRVQSEAAIDRIKLESYRWDPMYGGGAIGIDIHRH